MIYTAICREAEYLIVGDGAKIPEKALLHSCLYETRFFGGKSWEQ